MPTENYKFTGLADYAFVKSPNQFGKFSINLYCDKKTRAAIKATGLRGSAHEARAGSPGEDLVDGLFFVFRRDVERIWKGEKTALKPPYVVMEDGSEVTEIIGTGSKVTVEIELYDFRAGVDPLGNPYPAGKGARLVGVTVHELIPYVSAADASAEAPEAPAKASEEAPKQKAAVPF